MLGLLLATVGAAWLLQSSSSRRVRAAADILAQIRREGLESFWPADIRIDWYLARREQRIVGWRAVATGRSEDGEFLGVHLDMLNRKGDPACERWGLNADATEGVYAALMRTGLVYRPDTDITLRRGSVKVVQHNLPRFRRLEARSPAPENYLPEGLLEPVLQRVAAAGADAQFKLVFNERPNLQGAIEYGTFRIRHLGRKRESEAGWVDRVRVSSGGFRSGYSHTYELDERGRLLGIQDSQGLRWAPVSQSEVSRDFGNAPQYLLELMPPGLQAKAAAALLGRLQRPGA